MSTCIDVCVCREMCVIFVKDRTGYANKEGELSPFAHIQDWRSISPSTKYCTYSA